MARYYRRRSSKFRLEDGIYILLLTFVLAIFYPPVRVMVARLWYIYALMVVIVVGVIVNTLYHNYRLSKAGIDEIDKMSGTDFEMFLSNLFSKLGYKVQHTGRIGDYGSDLILEKDGIRTALQAKRYQEHVGPDSVREINTVLKYRNCTQGMVVTNSYYTEEAKILARANNISLWNRDDLVKSILDIKESTDKNIASN